MCIYVNRLWKKEDIHHRYYIILKYWDISHVRSICNKPFHFHTTNSNSNNNNQGHSKQNNNNNNNNNNMKKKAPVVLNPHGVVMSATNSKYSVKCSGGIVSSQGKKMKFDDA